jgi:KipI family sensor histidine kinase inhibitor
MTSLTENRDEFHGCTISLMGEGAVLFDPCHPLEPATVELQRKIWALNHRLMQSHNILEVIPGMNNILIRFDPLSTELKAITTLLSQCWEEVLAGKGVELTPKTHIIPVSYGGDSAEDLVTVAKWSGLSTEAVVELHSNALFTVFAIGSQPGLPYMGGLPDSLSIPRRDVPRMKVEAGAVIIGGGQASILSCTSACGWHIVGRTSMQCFDPTHPTPALFSPGDKVQFTVEEVLS